MAAAKPSHSESLSSLVNRILKPLGLVVLSRERIQETLNEAAGRGRVTRSDANDLVMELLRRGRQQIDELLGQTPVFPIDDYDQLTVVQIQRCLRGLDSGELRAVRDYERRHSNRKSVLRAIDAALRQTA